MDGTKLDDLLAGMRAKTTASAELWMETTKTTAEMVAMLTDAPDAAVLLLAGDDGTGSTGLEAAAAHAEAVRLCAEAHELFAMMLAKRHREIVARQRARCRVNGEADDAAGSVGNAV